MPNTRLKIFISSVQKEFETERQNLKSYLLGDAGLRRFISEVFLFEDLPARDKRADQTYLHEVERCDIYLGIFGYDYGFEDVNGVSPTEHEYIHASNLNKERLIYIWGRDESKRNQKMKALIKKASNELTRRRVEDFISLTSEVYASLYDYFEENGLLRILPFDSALCEGTTLKNISRKRIDWFLETARNERKFPLGPSTKTEKLLTHLNLLDKKVPKNAAILLFSPKPENFFRTAETKCISCHGIEYKRPFASQQIYTGDLFAQADQALDFVLSNISRSVGVRKTNNTASREYELPTGAVSEAIINALVHRDYYSNASVEVRLFSDRLEVWNPGSLPSTLTFESLRKDHGSVPYNPLLAEAFFQTHYIEKSGTGTQKIINLSLEAELPEPSFEQRDGFFVVTIWRDWLTDEIINSFDLNDRQKQAIAFLKVHKKITNAIYQEHMSSSKRNATRDLSDMVEKGVIGKVGTTGKGVYYQLCKTFKKA